MNVEPHETLAIVESIVYKSNGFATVLINPKDILPLALDRSDWPLSTDVKRSKSVWKLKEKISAASMSKSPIAAA